MDMVPRVCHPEVGGLGVQGPSLLSQQVQPQPELQETLSKPYISKQSNSKTYKYTLNFTKFPTDIKRLI